MKEKLETKTEAIARQLYGTYCEAVGGVAFDGKPLPTWAAFSSDPQKTKQAAAWLAVANARLVLCQRHMIEAGEKSPFTPE